MPDASGFHRDDFGRGGLKSSGLAARRATLRLRCVRLEYVNFRNGVLRKRKSPVTGLLLQAGYFRELAASLYSYFYPRTEFAQM